MKKHIPNTITCCNLICGCIATYFAILGSPLTAMTFIILGAIFDFFDGMSARLLHVSSEIGKELDSLADDITFGVAPASLVFWQLQITDYPDVLEPLRGILPFFAFVISAFSALRLAKFNLDTRQTSSFIGLPTPANALFWGAVIVPFHDQIAASPSALPLLLIGVCLSSWILVAEIPMFALKFKQWGWAGNELKYSFVGFCVLTILAAVVASVLMGNVAWCYAPFSLIIVVYVMLSMLTQKK